MKIQYDYCGLEVRIDCKNSEGYHVNPEGFFKVLEEFIHKLALYEHVDIHIYREGHIKE